MVLNSVSEFEVALIVNTLMGSSSPVPNRNPTRVVHAILPVILSPLAKLVNLSFEKVILPENSYLYKGGCDPANNRPISLLSVFSKIFGKAMLSRLLSFPGFLIFAWYPVWFLSESIYRESLHSSLEFHSFGNRIWSYSGSFILGKLNKKTSFFLTESKKRR